MVLLVFFCSFYCFIFFFLFIVCFLIFFFFSFLFFFFFFFFFSSRRRHTRLVSDWSSDVCSSDLDDGGLAHAGLADQNRIVLGAAAQNLNDALDFVFPPDEWIQRTFRSRLREVAAEFREQRSFFRPRRRCFFAGRARQLFPQRGQTQPALHQDFRAEALFLAQDAEEQMLGADVLVAQALRFFRRHV